MGICTKERKGVAAEVLMATPCINSLGGESEGHKQEGCGGRGRPRNGGERPGRETLRPLGHGSRHSDDWDGRERWVLMKIPRCDIDGVGEGKWP